MGGKQGKSSTRRGFTLLEMLVVLAVLAVLATLTWPAVRGMLGKGELRGAARQVRTALVKARLAAIESGAAQGFRYHPGGGQFEVAALPTSLDEEKTPSPSRLGTRLPDNEPIPGFLPEGVIFEENDPRSAATTAATVTTRAGSRPLEAERSPSPRQLAGEGLGVRGFGGGRDDANWSAPILFFPNGRSSSARIRLAGARGQSIEVTLRGANGATRIGPLERREERP
jgi:prepilin-type N-terminal cleavage/methylation domain-containing protein